MRIVVLGVFIAAFVMMTGDGRALSSSRQAESGGDAAQVDTLLVIAVDVSYSMDTDELAIQREGYAEGVVSPEFLSALQNGLQGRIAIAYFEWAAENDQKIIIPWRVIDGPESAGAVAREILNSPLRQASRTSISGAIAFGRDLIKSAPYRGVRQVIDISGDGPNNHGAPVAVARDEALRDGITINGLPLMVNPTSYGGMDIPELDVYYEDCVIGGAGAFVIPIKEREKFKDAIRTKLTLEVAGHVPTPRFVPASSTEPRISCTVGETMWQERMRR